MVIDWMGPQMAGHKVCSLVVSLPTNEELLNLGPTVALGT